MTLLKSDPPIVVQQIFDTPLPTVWKAITQPSEMRQWFFREIETFDPKIGFETRFVVENGERSFPHLWRVTKADPPNLIQYNWKYEGYQGDSHVSFQLTSENGSTKLTLTHQVTKDFQQGIPEFTRESCLEGWNYFIKESLKKYLEELSTNG